jgi:uncharacterized membrane protein
MGATQDRVNRLVTIGAGPALLAALLVAGCAPEPRSGRAGPSSSAPPDTVEYLAHGNEPFWAVRVTRTGIQFLEPDNQEGVAGAYASPTREGTVLVFRTVLRDSAGTPLELTLEEGRCSDGMSDRVYDYAAMARVGERVLRGCAEVRAH